MNQRTDALEQFHDLLAGSMYDIANAGMPEDDDLYDVFRGITEKLLDTFNVEITNDKPLTVVLTLK